MRYLGLLPKEMCPDNKVNWAGDEFVFNSAVSSTILYTSHDTCDMMLMTSLYISLILRVMLMTKFAHCSYFSKVQEERLARATLTNVKVSRPGPSRK